MADFKPTQKDYSSPNGYLIPNYTRRGISPAVTNPVTYNGAAQFLGEAAADLSVADRIDGRTLFPDLGGNHPATFDIHGLVKTSIPKLDTQTLRVHPVNWGRRRCAYGWLDDVTSVTESGLLVVSSAFSVTSATDGTDADGPARNGTTNNVANSAVQMQLGLGTGSTLQRRHRPYFYCKFKISSIADVRLWIAFPTAAITGSDSPTGSMIGLRFSSAASDTTFKLYSADGAAASVVDTGVTVAADTLYETELYDDGTLLYCRINRGDETSKSTNLPTNTTQLYNATPNSPGIYLTTLAAATKTLKFYCCEYSQF